MNGGTVDRMRVWLAAAIIAALCPLLVAWTGTAAAAGADCNGTAPAGGVSIDLNGDGCADAVVGIPDRTVGGKPHAGAVEIDLGSPTHHLRARSILVTAEHPHRGDRFGASLTMSNAGAAPTTLVVGTPGRDVSGVNDSGAVVTVAGRTTWPNIMRLPNSSFDVVANRPHEDARLGTALSIAGVPVRNSDGSIAQQTTVYAGAPGWNVDRQPRAGVVLAVPLDQLTHDGARSVDIISQDAPGVPGRSRSGDHFGSAIAADGGEGGGVGSSFLAVGTPGKRVDGRPGAGEVVVTTSFVSQSSGSQSSAEIFSQDSANDPNAPEKGDHFGATLLSTEGGLFVGVPDEDVGRSSDAGIVETFTLSRGYRNTLQQGKHHFPGRPEAGDHFGAALSYLSSSVSTDLCAPGPIVGVPGQDVAGFPDAGEVDCPARAPLRMGTKLPGSLQAHARVGTALSTIQSGRWRFQDPQECDCPGADAYLLTLVGAPGVRGGDGAVFAGARRHAPIWRRPDDPSGSRYGSAL